MIAAPTPRLLARALHVTLQGRAIVRGVDLALHDGELAMLVGPNGAGKTTLLRALAGVLDPRESTGMLSLSGATVAGLSRAERARRIAYVPQDVPQAAGFSVREVVAMGRAPHQGGWMRASSVDDEVVDEVLERCALTPFAERRFDALSGGERRQALIAQGLAQQTPILLLDEPAAFLDVRASMALLELLLAERARGTAILVSMHDLSLAARFADRCIVLDRGRVAIDGAPEHALDPTLLSRVFGATLRRLEDPITGDVAFVPTAAVDRPVPDRLGAPRAGRTPPPR